MPLAHEGAVKRIATVNPPRLVLWLGYGGLVPFFGFAVLIYLDRGRASFWLGALRAYSAVILSFVGALHWGFSMTITTLPVAQRHAMLTWSIVPCLVAFVALLAHSVVGDMLLVSTFLFHFLQDLRVGSLASLPAWYAPLRLRLSIGAIVCVTAGAFAAGW